MNKLRRIILVFVIAILLSGCTKNVAKEKTKKEIKDDKAITTLKNQIVSLESLTKTIELYTTGSGKSSDYSNEDKLLYGLNTRISSSAVTLLTPIEIQELATKNILNVSSYVDSADVGKYISEIFPMSSIEFKNVTGCPAYYYDKDASKFYIQNNCTVQNNNSIYSYIDKVEQKDSVYYVTVYAGLSDGANLYNDFAKSKVVVDLLSNPDYTITDKDKNEYTIFTYQFEKNSNGNYILKGFNK